MIAGIHKASRMLWLGTSRAAPRMAVPVLENVPSYLSPASAAEISPFNLTFPSEPHQFLKYNQGEIRDLEFSPNSLVLAVTSFDQSTEYSTTLNYYLTETDTPPYTQRHRHVHGRVSKQVAWLSNGNMLLVRLDHSIDLFATNSKLEHVRTIMRPQSIESAAWLLSPSKGEISILSAERYSIFKLSLNGNVIAKYPFENLLLRDIAVVPDSCLLLVVGRVLLPRKDVLPHNSRAEKQLLLYNMDSGEAESRNPILDDVRHVTLTDRLSLRRSGFDFLIGHKNRGSPHLWTLVPSLTRSHELKPGDVCLEPSEQFAGAGYFVGDQHEMISFVGMDGDIHILDRESGAPVHRIPAGVVTIPDGLRGVAWGGIRKTSMMFATVGTKELRIWSANSAIQEPGSQNLRTPGPSFVYSAANRVSTISIGIPPIVDVGDSGSNLSSNTDSLVSINVEQVG